MAPQSDLAGAVEVVVDGCRQLELAAVFQVLALAAVP